MIELNTAIIVNTLLSGGAEKQSVYLANALGAKHKVYIFVFHGKKVEDKIIAKITSKNVSIVFLSGTTIHKIATLYKSIRRNKISHIFTYLAKPNFIGGVIGRIANVKRIFSSIRTTVQPGWKILFERFTSNCIVTATIFNNFSGESKYKDRGFKRTLVIPNCFYNIAEPICRSDKKVLKIISVGRFTEAKDYLTAIRAVSELKKHFVNFEYQIIGYGKLEEQIKDWIKQYELDNFVKIAINPPNIPDLLIDSDIYLSTSKHEGLSNSILEAMNACLPIVATNVGDNDRMVFENVNGFLNDVSDYISISDRLLTLMSDYHMRINFGSASNSILKENYGYEKFMSQYYQLLEK